MHICAEKVLSLPKVPHCLVLHYHYTSVLYRLAYPRRSEPSCEARLFFKKKNNPSLACGDLNEIAASLAETRVGGGGMANALPELGPGRPWISRAGKLGRVPKSL